MKLSLIHKLFINGIDIHEFTDLIKEEVYEYSEKLKIKGTSVPIHVSEDYALFLGKNELLKLCKFYLEGKLTQVELYYIVDCLTMSESVSFENDEFVELIEGMTDPEVNGKITMETVHSVIKRIESF